MDEQYIEQSVRTRLILAGITELEEHGLTDFSLRRAATAAQVSCAAPYRHFRDKDEYIKQIIYYVISKWELLSCEIERIFSNDPPRLAVEMCMASLRFRVANRNFKTVFTLASRYSEGGTVDTAVMKSVDKYADALSLSFDEREKKAYTARALIAGSLMLVDEDNGERILRLAREKLEEEFC